MTQEKANKPDIYSVVTDRIVKALEAGTKPWTQPWQSMSAAGSVTRPLRYNGEAYSGINTLILWGYAMERGFDTPYWMTYKQAQELGAQVRKGETSAPVVYAGALNRSETDQATGEDNDVTIRFLKSYRVFNVEQIDGLPEHYHAKQVMPATDIERIERAEQFFVATGASIHHGGSSAYYAMSEDRIQMPRFEAFRSAEDYYATLGHECTHWTRHTKRLARDFGRKRMGDAGYAMEELVAELGAAYLCADLGLDLKDRDDHAAYIGSWLKVLKSDKRAIFAAAAHAQRAVEFLHACQEKEAAA